jgi:hypothetical protein
MHELDDGISPERRLLSQINLTTPAFANLADEVELIPDACAGP